MAIGKQRSLVWDLPTRLFHWLLVIAFVGAWLSSSSDRWLSIHVFLGYLMLGLIGFRIAWGWLGGHFVRFSTFVTGPKAAFGYLRDLAARRDAHYIGHNPAAGQAIIAMLLLGVAVGLTGVFTQGGEEQQGSVVGVLGIAAGNQLKQAHEWLAILMLLVVLGHLAGVALGTWLHKENLPLTMLDGMKRVPVDTPVSQPRPGVGVLLLALVASFGIWWFFYAWHEPLGNRLGQGDGVGEGAHVAFVGRALPDDPLWREECGSCHMAFHPNLLPARSWQAIMAGQASHFGSDLALDAPTAASVLAFMVANAAESSPTEAAFKMNRSIAAATTPLRVTEAPYWIDKHAGIAAAVYLQPQVKSKANCGACHLDAEAGTFEDAAMHIPRASAADAAVATPP